MSDKNMEPEELSKLEEQACFELCQIIAEAMQTQDIDLLDARISAWKIKYKKLIDGSVSNSKFKKKIEFLLNQYYSSVTRYIMQQIKIKEHIKIENQARALRKLYSIIKETNDLKTLKQKIKEWKTKYPYESFLKMYQKRIESATRERNLEDNAFDQDKAFSDLVSITKLNRTFEEFKYELSKWEKEYSIHNKYELDDFLRNKNEVKRYTSDEYLKSISRDDNELEKAPDAVEENTGFSNINKQAASYAALLSISSKPNNEAKMFEWVYKNRNIKFDDRYKELILAATYLDYSPTLLNRIKIPSANLSNSSVSLEEYNNINKLKKYSIISYFNLLLPNESRITNDYFNHQLIEIYNKSEKVKHQNSFTIETPSSKLEATLPEKDENNKEEEKEKIDSLNENDIEITVDESITNNENSIEIKLDAPIVEETKTVEIDTEPKTIEEPTEEIHEEPKAVEEPVQEIHEEPKTVVEPVQEIHEEPKAVEEPAEEIHEEPKVIIEQTEEIHEEPKVVEEPAKEIHEEPKAVVEPVQEIHEEPKAVEEPAEEIHEEPKVIIEQTEEIHEEPKVVEEPAKEIHEEPVEIVSISPMFFEAVHRHTMQAEIIEKIDDTADEYIEKGFDENTMDSMDWNLQKNKTE